MNNGSVISGDKLFDQFSYSATGNMPTSDAVVVAPVVDSGYFGIRVVGGFNDFAGGGASTATLTYRVSVLDPNLAINGALMFGNPSVVKNGYMMAETRFTPLPPSTSLSIFDQNPGDTQLWDDVDFDSVYPNVEVEVTLTGEAAGDSGAVTQSFVDNAFKQGVVPEPSSLLIWMGSTMLVGMVALLHCRRAPLPAVA